MYLFCSKKIVHLFLQLDEKSLAHITTQYSYAKYISQHTYITTIYILILTLKKVNLE